MVKATDLKLGNLVENEVFSRRLVESLSANTINGVSERGYYSVCITEDILKYFGFKRINYRKTYWFTKKRNGIMFITNPISPNNDRRYPTKLKFIEIVISERKSRRIRYVHDLQNAWKELTKQDLTIDLGTAGEQSSKAYTNV
ncbi:MAG: hypothetical protein PHT07_14945 [Paludibacter sp.]|nr:hypothetical protein [Paludibacter sp.]